MKKIIFFLLIIFSFTICVPAQVIYTVIPESPQPGDPVTIGVSSAIKEAMLFVNGKQIAKALAFSVPPEGRQRGFTAAILTVPSTAAAGQALIRLNDEKGGALCEIPIIIAEREFRTETLRMTAAMTSLVSDPDPQKDAEAKRLWEILTTTGKQIYHTEEFILPVNATRRTSRYGNRRVNIYPTGRETTSIHAGVDFGVPTGTPVFACGAGKVVLACMRILSGNSIIIEHGPGIYSIYYHLDSINVEEGAIVKVGAQIGQSGSTGFSTGPHLHWELRVSTENTDPDVFITRPVLDKELIISKIFN